MDGDKENALAEVQVPAKVEDPPGDIFDGIANVIVAGEVAHRDGRPEGRSIVVEVVKDGEGDVDIVNVGRRAVLDDFHRVLDKDKVKYLDVEVGADVTEDPEKMARLRSMGQRQIEAAQGTKRRKALEAKMGWPALPGIIESKLVEIEGKLPGLPGGEVNKEGGPENDTNEPEV